MRWIHGEFVSGQFGADQTDDRDAEPHFLAPAVNRHYWIFRPTESTLCGGIVNPWLNPTSLHDEGEYVNAERNSN